jgi:dolichol kinase
MLTKKEILRKTIHLSSVLIIFFDFFIGHKITIYSLFFVAVSYSVSEFLRVNNKFHVPLISEVTEYCSYSFEKRTFVYSPLIFAISMLILLAFFQKTHAYAGIIALGLGDGIAGLIGKKYGKKKIFYNKKKSLEGSLSMFFVVFLGSLFLIQDVFTSFVIGLTATFVESLSNEAIDNLTIPFSVILIIKLIDKL